MRVHFKIGHQLIHLLRTDLARRHAFAAERVGFLSCRVSPMKGGVVILGESYGPVEDEDYLDDPDAGAMMGPAAIRKALQFAYNNRVSMFHVHVHEHYGQPWFSRIDLRENAKFIPDFWHVRPEHPHGALVLSLDSAAGLCWYPRRPSPTRIEKVTFVGTRIQRIEGEPRD